MVKMGLLSGAKAAFQAARLIRKPPRRDHSNALDNHQYSSARAAAHLMILLIALDQIVHDRPGIGAATWRLLLKKSVDTGQLFWTAISMFAALGYDAIDAWNTHPAQHDFIGLICGLCLLGGFVCTVLVGFSTLRTATGGNTNWYVISASIAITGVLCVFSP
jgi:hypothetical protein